MANLSKQKRDRMIKFLETLKEQHKDDNSIRAFNEIENHLREKKYGLVWEEHSEQVDKILSENIPVFCEDTEFRIESDPALPYNFILEGDNLQSLYLLEKTHKGKIDVIYIDPPYNTGNKDFMYNDNYVEANDGFRHSKWLSFMHERLYIARNLLSEEGVIFISINNFEFGPLKLLCDELFEESNFIGNITWESTTQPINAGTAKFQLQQKTESIYCYAKNKQNKSQFILKKIDGQLNYPHIGKFGACRFEVIEKSDAGQYRRDTMKYKILGQLPRQGKRWQIGEKTARKLEMQGKVEIVGGIVKKAVYPEDEIDRIQYYPFWSHLTSNDVGTAQNGKEELNTILGFASGFDTVKPIKLISELLSHFKNNITVLDFFAGSGTTAQAVLSLNSVDNGNRKFIICTNNEVSEKKQIEYFVSKGYITSPPRKGTNAEPVWLENWNKFKNSSEYKDLINAFDYNCMGICHKITYPRVSTVITGKRQDDSVYSDGIPANLKYFKCDWTQRKPEDYLLSNALCLHIKEMIELQNAIEVDNKKYVLILNKNDFKNTMLNLDINAGIEKIWVNQNIIWNCEELKLLATKNFVYIPKEFFGHELKEATE